MKTTGRLLHAIGLALVLAVSSQQVVANSLHVTTNKLPAPKPELLNSEQLAEWRAKKTADFEAKKAAETQMASANAGVFYTGKPYMEESGTYAFLFRQYDPELSRWTSADPSGFPDGANNQQYVANMVTLGIDADGLRFIAFNGSSITVYDGAGRQADEGVDWGNAGQSWTAVSGGTAGKSPLPGLGVGLWYATSGPLTLGGIQAGYLPEKSLKQGDIHFTGTMSAWDQTSGAGYGGYDATWQNNWLGYDTKSGGTAPAIVEYKIGLTGIHGNTVSFGRGFRIHPMNASSTTGCIGIEDYNEAISFQTYINANIGISLLVE